MPAPSLGGCRGREAAEACGLARHVAHARSGARSVVEVAIENRVLPKRVDKYLLTVVLEIDEHAPETVPPKRIA